MKKIKNLIHKVRFNVYLYWLTFCSENYEWARANGTQDDCEYWGQRYAKWVNKLNKLTGNEPENETKEES